MSGNRIFDYSFFYKRRQDLVNSRNQYLNNVNGQRIIYNTQLSDWNASKQATFAEGAQTMVFRGTYGNGENISVGGIVNIPPYSSEPEVVTIASSATIPVPNPVLSSSPTPVLTSDPPAPAYAPNTQLLINPEFTDITNNSADDWVSSVGWQVWGYQTGTKPTAITNMPIRTDVYPTSASTGFAIFSYTTATISQTVPISNLVGINTITGILNIVNVSNGAADNFTFQIQYKNSTGAILYTKTTGSIAAPASWEDYTLILTRDDAIDPSKPFDAITSITVSITSKDTGFWAGQYGPAIDYCRLTVS
jgi:hypothetical protein